MGRLLEAPLKRFLRNPNATRDYINPVSNHTSALNNTISFLNDPKNDRKLILVGTLNASDLLAKRTEMLLKKYNPDAVLV